MVVLTEIAAALEGQLEIVSEVLGDSIQFFSYGRLLHLPSLVHTSAWDERCSRIKERYTLSPPRSAEEVQAPAILGGFAKVKQHSPTRCSHSVGAGASISRARLPVTPTPAFTARSDHRQPLDLGEARAKLATVLDEPRSSHSPQKKFGVDMRRATTETKYTEVLYGGRRAPATWWPRVDAPHSSHPSRISLSYHCVAPDDSPSRSGNSSRSIQERGVSIRGIFFTVVISEACDGSA